MDACRRSRVGASRQDRLAGLHMLNVYVCFNQISYVVACEHARSLPEVGSIVLVDRQRVVTQERYADLHHRALTRWGLTRTLPAVAFRRASRVYVPHDQGGRLVRMLRRSAGSYGLIDDGLDTLRDRPRNIDPTRLQASTELLTFTDYDPPAHWTKDLKLARACGLTLLSEDERAPADCSGLKVLCVESPGLDIERLLPTLGEPAGRVGVFVHGNIHKRGKVPDACVRLDGGAKSIERTLFNFSGAVHCGETMVTAFLLHCPRTAQLTVHLSRRQYDNLQCLHERFRAQGVELRIE